MVRPLEQYFTADKRFISELLKDITIDDYAIILEPCAGEKHLVQAMKDYDVRARFYTNDMDAAMPTQLHRDATKLIFWTEFVKHIAQPDWIITNPPFSIAPILIQYALKYCLQGVAFLLPINFLEACRDRTFLVKNPPTGLTVLPRYSFTQDGRMDTKTCAWFIWDTSKPSSNGIRIVSKFPIKE